MCENRGQGVLNWSFELNDWSISSHESYPLTLNTPKITKGHLDKLSMNIHWNHHFAFTCSRFSRHRFIRPVSITSRSSLPGPRWLRNLPDSGTRNLVISLLVAVGFVVEIVGGVDDDDDEVRADFAPFSDRLNRCSELQRKG